MEFIADGCTILIDDEDYTKIKDYKWHLMRKKAEEGNLFYFTTTTYLPYKERRGSVFLHRVIMDCQLGDGKIVDHKNHNTLDCRKENLRICTSFDNMRSVNKSKRNTSGYKGIHQNNVTKKWIARVQMKDSKLSLGTYDTPEEAARAYDRGALFHYGEFAITNFPRENYTDNDMKHLNQSTGRKLNHNSSGYIDIIWNHKNRDWRAVYKDEVVGYYKDSYEAYLAREKYIASLEEGK